MASQGEATQPTQRVLDPRRLGRDNSGLNEEDSSDIMLILVAGSPAATKIVEQMAETRDYHVLFHDMDEYVSNIEEQDTIILREDGTNPVSLPTNAQRPADLALRFSSRRYLVQMDFGWVFGRNATMSDIVFGQDSLKRISNQHFRIFLNAEGLTMIEDLSTNGTRVDNIFLRSKDPRFEKTRVLTANTDIIIANSANDHEMIRFHVRIPQRSTQAQIRNYEENKRAFMSECFSGQELEKIKKLQQQQPLPSLTRWNGGPDYTIMGELGKGAFATVYLIATKMNGTRFAAKELEKRRFMKDGRLDKKIENELAIMRNLKHPNVVQFVNYHDSGDHLYIIMEYAPFGDLRKRMDEGPLPESFVRSLAQQVLSALAHLHSLKVTHRDIKPDNILISELDPLQVKLSDFGLSKMVQHEDTFLKTFCGTLLYCAPEVFPFYEQSKKRRRGDDRAYSSACDIWSLGGVLWNALCGTPPFEGKQDGTGRAMFNHIMVSDLDLSPLKAKNISHECIDLLTHMLKRDPTERPSEIQCLTHPWLREGAVIPKDPTLESIVEEDESESEAEHQLSQLSITGDAQEPDDNDILFDEEFEELINPRESKRVRRDPLHPRYQYRDLDDDSSAAASPQSIMEGDVDDESFQAMPQTPTGRRLFGEIGHSALESSGILNVQANQALSSAGSAESGAQVSSQRAGNTNFQVSREISSSSLFGAETGVRELNMASPHSPGSGSQTSNEPATPKTPEVPQHSSLGHSQKYPSQNSEPTPRARPSVHSRLISLPKTPSFFYDPADPSTHNIEYAQRVSGYDFGVQLSNATAGASDLEDTMHQSGHTNDHSPAASATAVSVKGTPNLPTQTSFKAPPRRVGKLAATVDSFDRSLVLNLDQRQTSWGRRQSNTIAYEDITDVRIPKTAFIIFWWSPSAPNLVQELSQDGKDWTEVEDLQVGIYVLAKFGLWVNGKHIRQKDEKGRPMYGNLHTGDVIQVHSNPVTNERLNFRCEFYVGKGAKPRAAGENFKVLYGAKVVE
ncbi:kinase-like protein [Bimuria novae-zelandiae CBS 107.79]|uniref:Kinase-like protein n=1 Tax=Bimuria novae-zelandiae CBS 107.79 TaxID=1447943 RepID=A0A6A5V134_9PLEO|nr:kinase-like protein [Bimuria novae-zelandiae CBS 107.79]